MEGDCDNLILQKITIVARNLLSSQSCGISVSDHCTSLFCLKFSCIVF